MAIAISLLIQFVLFGINIFFVYCAKQQGFKDVRFKAEGIVAIFIYANVVFATACGWFLTKIVLNFFGLESETSAFITFMSICHALTVFYIAVRWLFMLLSVFVFSMFITLVYKVIF